MPDVIVVNNTWVILPQPLVDLLVSVCYENINCQILLFQEVKNSFQFLLLCVLATEVQLDQLVINCTGEDYSIATVDPTFNLGDFYVIPIVFKSKKFVRKC